MAAGGVPLTPGGISLPTGEVPLTFGNSFSKNFKEESYHSIRYDFKPASVDVKKKGSVLIGDKYDITVTIPHIQGSGTNETTFKGSRMIASKECILIFDQTTGQITLERISQKIALKKTRPDTSIKKPIQSSALDGPNRKLSPSRGSPSRLTSRSGMPSSSPLINRPSPNHTSHKSSPNYNKASSHSQKNKSAGATSMPSLDFDEESNKDELMSESSSDSDSNSGSSSSSDSDSDSEPENNKVNPNNMINGVGVTRPSPSVFDDLQLSDED